MTEIRISEKYVVVNPPLSEVIETLFSTMSEHVTVADIIPNFSYASTAADNIFHAPLTHISDGHVYTKNNAENDWRLRKICNKFSITTQSIEFESFRVKRVI